jgi:hypothetical protein
MDQSGSMHPPQAKRSKSRFFGGKRSADEIGFVKEAELDVVAGRRNRRDRAWIDANGRGPVAKPQAMTRFGQRFGACRDARLGLYAVEKPEGAAEHHRGNDFAMKVISSLG